MKTNFTPPVLAAALLACSLGALPNAHAQLLTNESFTGYPVNGDLVGQNGGTGWGGAWASPNSDGFLRSVRTPTAIAYPGYNATSSPAASGGNYLNLAAGFGGANPSSVFRSLNTSASGVYGAGGYLLSPGLIGADNRTLWGSLLYSNGGPNSVPIFSLDGTSLSINLPQTAASNLLVFRLDFRPGATDTVTLFSNPNLATFDGTSGGSTTAAGNYQFATLRLTESLNGGSGSEVQFDDLRFGATLLDVAPSAVPEPSTFALALLGAAATLVLGKKSRALRAKNQA